MRCSKAIVLLFVVSFILMYFVDENNGILIITGKVRSYRIERRRNHKHHLQSQKKKFLRNRAILKNKIKMKDRTRQRLPGISG